MVVPVLAKIGGVCISCVSWPFKLLGMQNGCGQKEK